MKAAEEEDYIFRISAMVAEMLQRVTKLRESGQDQSAFSLLLLTQEKLFGRPCALVTALTIDEQLRLLALDERVESAWDKQLAYAALLTEAGLIYRMRANPVAAASAFQLALYITLFVANEQDVPAKALPVRITELLPLVPAEQHFAPTAALLERWTTRSSSTDDDSVR